MYKTSLHEAHAEIDRIYFDILPKHEMEVREGQIALCHTMLDAFADKNISLCHAGVGIGKTAAYLIAAVIWNKYQPDGLGGGDFSPFLIATSSIALQNAIIEDYIPRLSEILCAEGVIDEPFTGILRKGKGNYVCPRRLARRIETMNPEKRNKQKLDALLALRLDMDLGKASRMSQYDKERVAIPDTCPRKCEDADDCAFMRLHEAQQQSTALIQVCNHNYLLADALNQHRGYSPLLPTYRGLVVDEAHKLAAAAQDMCRYRFDCGDSHDYYDPGPGGRWYQSGFYQSDARDCFLSLYQNRDDYEILAQVDNVVYVSQKRVDADARTKAELLAFFEEQGYKYYASKPLANPQGDSVATFISTGKVTAYDYAQDFDLRFEAHSSRSATITLTGPFIKDAYTVNRLEGIEGEWEYQWDIYFLQQQGDMVEHLAAISTGWHNEQLEYQTQERGAAISPSAMETQFYTTGTWQSYDAASGHVACTAKDGAMTWELNLPADAGFDFTQFSAEDLQVQFQSPYEVAYRLFHYR